MTAVTGTLALLLILLALLQALPTLKFARILRSAAPQPLADDACPAVLVVLCLRGSDPFLADCLRGLLAQQYPSYQVRIVVDQPDDPAWQVVDDVVRDCGAENVAVDPLAERFDTCSLKSSSLIQALSDLDESIDVVALLDGDTVPHPTWLRELVAPLMSPEIGVSSGNRWYMPRAASWGSLVRYCWNAAAVVQMYLNHFTWGGSVALKADLVRGGELLASWRMSVSTDTVIYNIVRQYGYRTAFVPSLMMVNHEGCTLPEFFRWVQRQMVVARLYHPGWFAIVGHGVLTSLLPVVALSVLVAGLNGGNEAAQFLGGALALYFGSMFFMLLVLERSVRRVVRQRNEPTDWTSLATALKTVIALPLTQFIYAAALLKVTRLRSVEWRGVKYRIEGPFQIRMIEYQPFAHPAADRDPLASL